MSSLPIFSNDIGFTRYLQEIRNIPSLTLEEEILLTNKYKDDQDVGAAHRLVTSHLKLVAKIATSFKNYGLPLVELVFEGNIGLMQAVKKFDPDLGFRLSTYAVWWIKASIQEYILRSWSIVKLGTTSAQKKLFYSLGKLKKLISVDGNSRANNLSPEDVSFIAKHAGVSEENVVDMNSRMSYRDVSLNSPINYDSDEEMIDLIAETKANQETNFIASEELSRKQKLVDIAMNEALDTRQRDIISKRMLQGVTLEELSQEYNISRERVRQIETRALEKLQQAVLKLDKQSLVDV